MQWSAADNAGFSACKPWFYVNPNYKTVNAESEDRDPESILNFYRQCLALRKSSETLLKGSYREYMRRSRHIYMFERAYRDERILVICSFSEKPVSLRIPRAFLLKNRAKTDSGAAVQKAYSSAAEGMESEKKRTLQAEVILDNYGTSCTVKMMSDCLKPVVLQPYEVKVLRI
jgi:glycosidase